MPVLVHQRNGSPAEALKKAGGAHFFSWQTYPQKRHYKYMTPQGGGGGVKTPKQTKSWPSPSPCVRGSDGGSDGLRRGCGLKRRWLFLSELISLI